MRRLHLVSIPWTATTDEYLTCAYTQKVVKFCRMYEKDPDTHITLYASEFNDAPCDEHVHIFTEQERHKFFGDWGTEALFEKVTWDEAHPAWRLWNSRLAAALMTRSRGDIVLLGNGNPFIPVERSVRAFLNNDVLVIEPFVGYEGIFTDYCAFESHTWRNHVYGLNQWRYGRWYDTTIPNYFDKKDFPYVNDGSGEYLLFVGRVTERKGVNEAYRIARASGLELFVAGPGVSEWGDDFIIGDHVEIRGPGIKYLGEIDANDRSVLMAGAKALLAPTLYVEPFGGVAVEAQMCGTPVISTDWGAFPETVEHGKTGFRVNTLREGVDAVGELASLKPSYIQRRARKLYSLEAVKPQFDRWFGQLQGLWGEGWSDLRSPRDPLVVDRDPERS